MSKTKKKALPKWFNGDVYSEGGEIKNRFTGEACVVDAEEMSMYDFIMGCEMFVEMRGGFLEPSTAKLQGEMAKGISWFRQRNPSAYMILLD